MEPSSILFLRIPSNGIKDGGIKRKAILTLNEKSFGGLWVTMVLVNAKLCTLVNCAEISVHKDLSECMRSHTAGPVNIPKVEDTINTRLHGGNRRVSGYGTDVEFQLKEKMIGFRRYCPIN